MKEDEKVKFQSKAEIAHAIQVLTPFTTAGSQNIIPEDFEFALDKVKELTKLL